MILNTTQEINALSDFMSQSELLNKDKVINNSKCADSVPRKVKDGENCTQQDDLFFEIRPPLVACLRI